MTQSNQPFAQEGYDLMAAAFEVHNVMGGGLLEEIYQQSLEIELGLRGIPFRRKEECRCFTKGTCSTRNTSRTYSSLTGLLSS